jgi:hypothetical protein
LDAPQLAMEWNVCPSFEADFEFQPSVASTNMTRSELQAFVDAAATAAAVRDVAVAVAAPGFTLAGATGMKAAIVNGTFVKLDEQQNGKSVYGQVGNPTWCCWYGPDRMWMVSRSTTDKDANKAAGIAHSVERGLDAPQLAKEWKVWPGFADFEFQRTVTTRTLTEAELQTEQQVAMDCAQTKIAELASRAEQAEKRLVGRDRDWGILQLAAAQDTLYIKREANQLQDNPTPTDLTHVALLHSLAAVTSKQAAAIAKLARLRRSGSSTDLAVVIVAETCKGQHTVVLSDAVQKQYQLIADAEAALKEMQKTLLGAAQFHIGEPDGASHRTLAGDGGGGISSDSIRLSDDLERTVQQRDTVRREFLHLLDNFDKHHYHFQLISRLQFLQDQITALRAHSLNHRSDTCASEHEAGAGAGDGDSVTATVGVAALAAFDKWKAPTSVISTTDAALEDLGNAIASQLKRTITKGKLEESLSTTLVQIDKENMFWTKISENPFPRAQLDGACQRLIAAFELESVHTEHVLSVVAGWTTQATELHENVAAPEHIEEWFKLDEEVYDLQKALRGKLNDVKEEEIRLERKRKTTSLELDGAHVAVRSTRAKVRIAAAKFRTEKQRLSLLAQTHFPELALRFPDADLFGVADFKGLVRRDITFEKRLTNRSE